MKRNVIISTSPSRPSFRSRIAHGYMKTTSISKRRKRTAVT